MTAPAKTIAVVGSTPFAWLLAGLLATDHSRAVVLVSDTPASHRLWPIPSISVGAVTRPELASLLSQEGPRAARRINRIAGGSARRADLSLTARGGTAGVALSHMRHMLAGFGHIVEPGWSASGTNRLRVRDVWQFQPTPFLAAAPGWLAGANVAVVNAASGLKINRDGSAGFGATPVDLVVLADDAAIVSRLSAEEIASFASVVDHLGIVTEPIEPLSTPVTLDLDTGSYLVQSADGQITAQAPDDDGRGLDRIMAALPETVTTRLAARAHLPRLVTHDGAPALGPTRRSRLYVIAGLGANDMAMAPFLAQMLAGGGSGFDAEWTASHGSDLRQPRSDVADFVPGRAGAGL